MSLTPAAALFFQQFSLAAPLFGLAALGYALMRGAGWPKSVADGLNLFVFNLALPVMLFRMMSDLSNLPPVDLRVMGAFFGSCLIVFVIGRLLAWRVFRLDGVAQSVFALGGVFSNNVMLGIPLAKLALGDASMPSVALVVVFNAMILWTLVTVSVEWARHGELSLSGLGKMTRGVATNPIVASIVGGTLFGAAGLHIPAAIDAPLAMVAQAAAPMALIALGMGLAEFGIRAAWRQSAAICALKLALQPLVVWLLARLFGLPPMETATVVLLASLPVGANVYLMSRQFGAMEAPVAASLVISAALSAFTTPLILTLVHIP
ncbi:MAG: AEC family transporter [Burkholderiaceae bacterium]|nr:AEC family transporter [Burkholderiaceae bacterium]